MGRRRNPENADLPVGLYANRDKGSASGYYYYTNPFFGIENIPNNDKHRLPLGSDKDRAIKRSEEIKKIYAKYQEQTGVIKTDNAIVQSNKAKNLDFRLPKFKKVHADKISNIDGLVDHALVKLEEEYLNSKIKKSLNSKRNIQSYLNRIKQRWKNLPVEFINSENIQVHIDEIISTGKINTAGKFKTQYQDLLKHGLRYGLIDYDNNPAKIIKVPKTKVQKSRLSAMTALEVLDSEKLNYQPNKLSIMFGLITAMRPQDFTLTRAQKGDDWEERVQTFIENRNMYDELALSDFEAYAEKAPYPYIDKQNNCLVYFSQKTGEIAAIDLDLYNNTLKMTLNDLLTEIKSICTCTDSPFLIHHTLKNSKVKHGSVINPTTLSKKFTQAIKELNKNWINGSHPTLYELRSLGMRNEPVELSATTKPPQSFCKELSKYIKPVSTLEEKVAALVPVKEANKLGGHTIKSKIPRDVYFKKRDLAYQQLSGFT